MDNKENQGNYLQMEQPWVCPDCETVNIGSNCAVCGCLRPDEKQEPEPVPTFVEQGSYKDALQEWICPNCETRNVGKTCTACGYSSPTQVVGNNVFLSNHFKIAVLVGLLVVTIITSGIAVWPPYHRYQNAYSLLESGQYEQAYQAFSAMPDYRDSSTLRNQAVVQWADHLEKNGEYDKAVKTLAYLPADEQATEMKKQLCIQWAEELRTAGKYTLALKSLEPVSELDGIPSMITAIRYSKAKWLLDDKKNYGDAYQEFVALGAYRDSELSATEAAKKWILEALDHSDVSQAERIRDTVKLSSSLAQNLYQELYTRDIYDYSPERGLICAYHPDDLSVRRILLEMLPGSYPYKAKLNMLFTALDVSWPSEFVWSHIDILKDLWYMPIVENIVRNDQCVAEWLLGTWRTENGSYYLKFYQNDSGGISSQYTLPWIPTPKGTKYYNIKNLTYVLIDENSNVLAEVYRFKLLEPDKIEVYAFKDQKTYTMVRK